MKNTTGLAAVIVASLAGIAGAETCNIKVLTDNTPDYTDMPSMVRSMAGKWKTDEEKCFAVWYWNHLGRRQTMPMNLHGLDCSDPIRQFNDYGYMMCSTIAGANCAIWHHMGYNVRYNDVVGHTVPEVEYGGKLHMYDDSMSNFCTLCDGKTVASCADIKAEGSCDLSGGKVEKFHAAKYHSFAATSSNGWLTGADLARSLDGWGGCFNRIDFRYYYNEWDWGHNYRLNLREGESYTRYTQRQDGYDPGVLDDAKKYKSNPMYYVPNVGLLDPKKPAGEQNLDPESCNLRFFIRGNGTWDYSPALTAAGLKDAYKVENVGAAAKGLAPVKAGQESVVIFSVHGANVITGQKIRAIFNRKTAEEQASISVSSDNGLKWQEVWKAENVGEAAADIKLQKEVNGAYDVLVQVKMLAKAAPGDVRLDAMDIRTITQVNSKTLPQLALGKNTVYVGVGEQTKSVVIWPDLQGQKYKDLVADEKNIATRERHEGWREVLWPKDKTSEAHLVYKLDTPGDMTNLEIGGRFYNKDAGSAAMEYSTDGGKNWKRVWESKSSDKPWDVMQYSTVSMPAGTRNVLVKYVLNAWGLYALRIEGQYLPNQAGFKPMDVTYTWTERHGDVWGKGLVTRSHRQIVDKVPFRYTINVGGDDVPELDSIQVNLASTDKMKYGYSDDKDVGGEKYYPKWVTCGKNLAQGKSYTTSVASVTDYGAAPAEKKLLTDGIVGPCHLWNWQPGHLWKPDANPTITVDLGSEQKCAAFGVNFMDMGDLLRGNLAAKTKIEVLISADGKDFKSAGTVNTLLRLKDLPINWIRPDDPNFGATSFYLVLKEPVKARFVQYKVVSPGFFCPTELFALDSYKSEPFDLKLMLPDEK